MKVAEALRALSMYPIPDVLIQWVGAEYELDLELDYTPAVGAGYEYVKATQAVYRWLSTAPDVTQGGQTYRLSHEERARFAELGNMAHTIPAGAGGPEYGCKGGLL